MKLIALVASACAAVGFNSNPAGAVIATPDTSTEPGQYVAVGHKWRAEGVTICGRFFPYVQRMTIDGVSAMVPTEFIYSPGRHALYLQDTCDCYRIYGVGDAAV